MEWAFDGLTPGDYQVSVTWKDTPNRATDAPFEIIDEDAAASLGVFDVNQQLAPTADYTEGGRPFQNLTTPVALTGTTLVVRLSDDANAYVIADAVRIERVS